MNKNIFKSCPPPPKCSDSEGFGLNYCHSEEANATEESLKCHCEECNDKAIQNFLDCHEAIASRNDRIHEPLRINNYWCK